MQKFIHKVVIQCLRASILGLCLLLASSCAGEPLDPSIPYGFLSKSRDYLYFCLSLMDSSRPLYNQFASRYYYAMFSIAKISSIWKHKHFHGESELHEEVWKVTPHEVRKVYGQELKSIRTKCDYLPDFNDSSSECIMAQLVPIVQNAKAFESLVKDVKEILPKYYARADQSALFNESNCSEIIDCITKLSDEIKQHNKITPQ